MYFNSITNINNYKLYKIQLQSVFENYQYAKFMLSTVNRSDYELFRYYNIKVQNCKRCYQDVLSFIKCCALLLKNTKVNDKLTVYCNQVIENDKMLEWNRTLAKTKLRFGEIDHSANYIIKMCLFARCAYDHNSRSLIEEYIYNNEVLEENNHYKYLVLDE